MADNPLGSDWFIGFNEKTKSGFKDQLELNQRNAVLKQLIKILYRKLEMMENAEGTVQLYDQGWQFKQAHYNGARASINYVLKLLTFVDKDK